MAEFIEVEVTITLQVSALLASHNHDGEPRTDLVRELVDEITTAIEEDMPYEPDSRDPHDLVQSTPVVTVLKYTQGN